MLLGTVIKNIIIALLIVLLCHLFLKKILYKPLDNQFDKQLNKPLDKSLDNQFDRQLDEQLDKSLNYSLDKPFCVNDESSIKDIIDIVNVNEMIDIEDIRDVRNIVVNDVDVITNIKTDNKKNNNDSIKPYIMNMPLDKISEKSEPFDELSDEEPLFKIENKIDKEDEFIKFTQTVTLT